MLLLNFCLVWSILPQIAASLTHAGPEEGAVEGTTLGKKITNNQRFFHQEVCVFLLSLEGWKGFFSFKKTRTTWSIGMKTQDRNWRTR